MYVSGFKSRMVFPSRAIVPCIYPPGVRGTDSFETPAGTSKEFEVPSAVERTTVELSVANTTAQSASSNYVQR